MIHTLAGGALEWLPAAATAILPMDRSTATGADDQGDPGHPPEERREEDPSSAADADPKERKPTDSGPDRSRRGFVIGPAEGGSDIDFEPPTVI